MKTIPLVFLSKRECSVREAAYILPVLKLRNVLPAIPFVNTNVPEERTLVVLSSKKELNELLDDRRNIFNKLNISRYINRQNALFSGGKYSDLDNFCLAEFSAYNTIDNKPDD